MEAKKHFQKVTDMTRVLYSYGAANSDASRLDRKIIVSLTDSGLAVDLMIAGPDQVETFEELADGNSNVSIVKTGQNLSLRQFAWEVALRAKSSDYELVVASGVELSRSFGRTSDIHSRLWVVLPSAELVPQLGRGISGRSYLSAIVQHPARILVEDSTVMKALRSAVPAEGGRRIICLDEDQSPSRLENTDQVDDSLSLRVKQMISQHAAKRRVLFAGELASYPDEPEWMDRTRRIYEAASRLASETNHVILLHYGWQSALASGQVYESSPYVTVIEPAPSPHQLEGQRVLPRFAAWHILIAVEQLSCSAVVVGDLETGTICIRNATLAKIMWQVLDFDSLDDLNRLSDPQYSDLLNSAPRLVVADESRRSLLEARFEDATSKTVVIPPVDGYTRTEDFELNEADMSHSFGLELHRLLPDYDSVPKILGTRNILVAGHDFKFAGELLESLEQRNDIELRVDSWTKQDIQNTEQSETLLKWADLILCEFSSHNAVWYSWMKKQGQALVVRFHGYELFSKVVHDINVANVDIFVFVSEAYREKVIADLGWPREKTAVIPNIVDAKDLDRTKIDGSRFHLGIAGIVPILKRPDRALDLLEALLEVDPRYTLHIRGHFPWNYKWVWANDDVRDAYEAFYERIATNPSLQHKVAFEEFGPDMGRWFRKIGWALSPSWRETFHLAPVEGMASGAVPVVWEREGADEIFDQDWIHPTTAAAAKYIASTNDAPGEFDQQSERAQERAARFDVVVVRDAWLSLLLHLEGVRTEIPGRVFEQARCEELFLRTPNAMNLRKLLQVLHREGEFDELDSLLTEHSALAEGLELDLVGESLRRRGVIKLRKNGVPIPERSSGPTFLVNDELILYVVDPQESITKDDDGPVQKMVSVVPVTDSGQYIRASRSIEGREYVTIPLKNSKDLTLDHQVLLAADALVREARRFRPVALRTQRDFWVALPAIIAARRLGIPVVCDLERRKPELGDKVLDFVVESEVDYLHEAGSHLKESVVCGLAQYAKLTKDTSGRTLSDLRVGVIADQFTSRTIERSFQLIPLSRAEGFIDVVSLNLDAIFIESAWEGPEDEWRRGVAGVVNYEETNADLIRIIQAANMKKIPVMFWNKEDPVHFRNFARAAALCDHVFTTDGDMIGLYLAAEGSKNLTVSSAPFYAEPLLHNPLPVEREYEHSISFAGTYYGDRFKERSTELNRILTASSPFGLVIYDRQVDVPNSPYSFPNELSPYIRSGVHYDEVLKVYKSHPVNINVNSVSDSPTMFSRRVVEVAASGSLVLSGEGRGVSEQFEAIEASGSSERWNDLLKRWMTDEDSRLEDTWSQLRSVTRAYLSEHALTVMFRTAGFQISYGSLPRYVLEGEEISVEQAMSIARQTWRPHSVITTHLTDQVSQILARVGISVVGSSEDVDLEQYWIGRLEMVSSESHYEDLLHATRFGEWDRISARYRRRIEVQGTPLLELEDTGELPGLSCYTAWSGSEIVRPLTWIFPS